MSIRKLALATAMFLASGAAHADFIASQVVRLNNLESVYYLLSDQDAHQSGKCMDIEGAKVAVVAASIGGRMKTQFSGCYFHIEEGKIGLYFWDRGEKIDGVFAERDLTKFQKTKAFKGW